MGETIFSAIWGVKLLSWPDITVLPGHHRKHPAENLETSFKTPLDLSLARRTDQSVSNER